MPYSATRLWEVQLCQRLAARLMATQPTITSAPANTISRLSIGSTTGILPIARSLRNDQLKNATRSKCSAFRSNLRLKSRQLLQCFQRREAIQVQVTQLINDRVLRRRE